MIGVETKIWPEPGFGEEESVGLYIHIPFCRTKCPYCSFNSYPGNDDIAVGNYLTAVLGQAEMMAASWAGDRKFATLFIGGGTPTIYGAEDLAGLLAACHEYFQIGQPETGPPEISIEANPNTVSREKFVALQRVGVNRLSIGVQSFSDRMLESIGRSHCVADAVLAFESARAAGFANINLDLMYGLPDQAISDWRKTLETALDLAPEHLALYELTIEDNTPFAVPARRDKLALPDEETVLRMEDLTAELLDKNGFVRYEISNYARPGFECRHNITYWNNGSYVGLGAGAVSCLGGLRVKNVADPAEFSRLVALNKQPFSEAECLPVEDRFRETVIMGLRMLAGISEKRLQARFGITFREYYGKTLENLISQGLINQAGDRIRLTDRGLPVANYVLAQLV